MCDCNTENLSHSQTEFYDFSYGQRDLIIIIIFVLLHSSISLELKMTCCALNELLG